MLGLEERVVLREKQALERVATDARLVHRSLAKDRLRSEGGPLSCGSSLSRCYCSVSRSSFGLIAAGWVRAS
jgi:hypothetical protein